MNILNISSAARNIIAAVVSALFGIILGILFFFIEGSITTLAGFALFIAQLLVVLLFALMIFGRNTAVRCIMSGSWPLFIGIIGSVLTALTVLTVLTEPDLAVTSLLAAILGFFISLAVIGAVYVIICTACRANR